MFRLCRFLSETCFLTSFRKKKQSTNICLSKMSQILVNILRLSRNLSFSSVLLPSIIPSNSLLFHIAKSSSQIFCLNPHHIIASTGWFISNRTVQNTDLSADADELDKKFCIEGKLWNHRIYSVMSFDSSLIFLMYIDIYLDKRKEQNTRT